MLSYPVLRIDGNAYRWRKVLISFRNSCLSQHLIKKTFKALWKMERAMNLFVLEVQQKNFSTRKFVLFPIFVLGRQGIVNIGLSFELEQNNSKACLRRRGGYSAVILLKCEQREFYALGVLVSKVFFSLSVCFLILSWLK